MALQDVCNFKDNRLEGIIVGCNRQSVTETTGCNCRSWSKSLFDFYIPVAEYMEDVPIQFGQIKAVRSPSIFPPQNSTLPSPSSSLNLAPSQGVPLPFPLSHGTTTLAFVFQGGVLAAADTRSSCAGLVACPASQKILPIHSHLVGTTSGTSADCVLWKRILSRELRLYQLRHGRRLSTAGAAKLLSHMLHPFKGTEVCVAATLCGWDGGETHRWDQNEGTCSHFEETTEGQTADLEEPVHVTQRKNPGEKSEAPCFTLTSCEPRHFDRPGLSGPSLYYVCSDGTRLQGTLFSVGSGSPYAYSILDEGVKWELKVNEAVSLAREAVYRATHRDAYSGNSVDIFHISSKGWRRRHREDLREEYYRKREGPHQMTEKDKV